MLATHQRFTPRVENRCAITKLVCPFISVAIAFWMTCSVWASTLLVASSRIIISGFATIARVHLLGDATPEAPDVTISYTPSMMFAITASPILSRSSGSTSRTRGWPLMSRAGSYLTLVISSFSSLSTVAV